MARNPYVTGETYASTRNPDFLYRVDKFVRKGGRVYLRLASRALDGGYPFGGSVVDDVLLSEARHYLVAKPSQASAL